jgi:hypothetical protein
MVVHEPGKGRTPRCRSWHRNRTWGVPWTIGPWSDPAGGWGDTVVPDYRALVASWSAKWWNGTTSMPSVVRKTGPRG